MSSQAIQENDAGREMKASKETLNLERNIRIKSRRLEKKRKER